jgi:hypothetical protein
MIPPTALHESAAVDQDHGGPGSRTVCRPDDVHEQVDTVDRPVDDVIGELEGRGGIFLAQGRAGAGGKEQAECSCSQACER